MIKRRKVMWWIFISLILATFNVFTLVTLFSLAYQFDSVEPSQWVSYLFTGAWFFFGPVVLLIGKIDAVIRIQDYWYYMGAIFNGIIWANALMYIASKNRQISRIFRKLSQ